MSERRGGGEKRRKRSGRGENRLTTLFLVAPLSRLFPRQKADAIIVETRYRERLSFGDKLLSTDISRGNFLWSRRGSFNAASPINGHSSRYRELNFFGYRRNRFNLIHDVTIVKGLGVDSINNSHERNLHLHLVELDWNWYRLIISYFII